MRTIQLYGTATATANAVAQVTIPSAARIKGIGYWLQIDGNSDNVQVRVELSKVPVSQILTNGGQEAFFGVASWVNLTTSGMTLTPICGYQPLDVQCRQGEIIYLHCSITATLTFHFNGILWY